MYSALVSLEYYYLALQFAPKKSTINLTPVHGFEKTIFREMEGKDISIGVRLGLKGTPSTGTVVRLELHAIPGTAGER